MKKSIYSIACIPLCLSLSKFCDKQTGKFSIHKIENNFDITKGKIWADRSIPEEVKEIVGQPFSYLGKGKTSFVFASKDNKYVIKLFNNRYQKKIHCYETLSCIPFIRTWAQKNLHYYQLKLSRNFDSFRIAKEILPDETAYVYLHQVPSADDLSICIQDKLGSFHNIWPSKTAFFLQKKAQPFYQALNQAKIENDLDKGKQLLTSLFDLLLSRNLKGIEDKDPILRTNFGFIDTVAVELDVGPFVMNQAVKNKRDYSQEIRKTTRPLACWLEKNYKELSPHLMNLYQTYLDAYE